jgi:hypothetical protein
MVRKRLWVVTLFSLIMAAPSLATATTGYLDGYVTDSLTGYRIYGATVRLEVAGTWFTTATDAHGYYELQVPAGAGYPMVVLKQNYQSFSGVAPTIEIGGRSHMDVVLIPLAGTGFIEGTVTDELGQPLEGARVVITGAQRLTDEQGYFSVRVAAGSGHTFLAQMPCHQDKSLSGISVPADETVRLDVVLLFPDAYAGAYQIGDSGCFDGVLNSDDLDEMLEEISTGTGDYSGGIPPTPMLQDLDGDGYVQAADHTILNNWILGLWDNPMGVGMPDNIDLIDPPSEAAGSSSVPLMVNVTGSVVLPRVKPGWGVVFEVDQGQTTCNAQLAGRPFPSVTGSGRYFSANSSSVFEYTDDQGNVTVPLSTSGCWEGDAIVVEVRIPSDEEAGLSSRRLQNTLYAEQSFTISVISPPSPPPTGWSVGSDTLGSNPELTWIHFLMPLLFALGARMVVKKKSATAGR